MKIPNEKIENLRKIYREKYGEDISFEEAELLGEHLVNFFRAVYNV